MADQDGPTPNNGQGARDSNLPPSIRRLLDSGSSRSPWDDGFAIRSELFSVERLEIHARSLAASQTVADTRPARVSLHRRLSDNEKVLVAAYKDVAQAIEAGAGITPAAEWLIDNFHIVEKQIREIRLDLPPGYYKQLPKLAGGPLAGYPRVLGIAWAFVAHTDSLFDPEVLRRFLGAYQEVQPLTIGELWAVAITLRVMLVENLRRIAKRVHDSRGARASADVLADRLLGAGGQTPESADIVLPKHSAATYPEAFLVQMVQRLRDQDPGIGPALSWLDEQLSRQGTSADEVVREEHQRQVAASLTVRNIITSMRLISDVDWTEFFERVSLVDEVLSQNGHFARMDFSTRNLYRNAVEELARGSSLTELDVARAAVAAAQRGRSTPEEVREADAGYYLISYGRANFERLIRFRAPARQAPGRAYRALGVIGYVLAGVLIGALILAGPIVSLYLLGTPAPLLALLAVLGLLPAIDASVAVVNHLVTRGFRATLLPAIDFRGGVPAAHRTLVVVPTMLTSLKGVAEQIEQLEIHHLASVQGEVYFALLTDWADAASETLEQDEALLSAAQSGVDHLNKKYAPGEEGPRFYLLHRRRVWSKSENRWMGWERKRGKLSELNRLLRNDADTTFMAPPKMPSGVKYVVTLDADTRLPRETLRRLIGKMAHPLNRPRFDAQSGRVVEGHAILQPRVTPSLPIGREASPFLRIFSSANGIDPYAAAVSDVYQDLFGEGSYTGKGIYDVDAFEASLAGRVPDSTLLSHDLFEGVFGRAGLASDVEVVEEFPSRYDVASRRNHRWIRGDWQLLPWIIGRGPGDAAVRARGGVTAIGRWKMLDNLRRSMNAPAIVAALLAGLALPLQAATLWAAFIVGVIVLPSLVPVVTQIFPRAGVTVRSHVRALGREAELAVAQAGLAITFVGDQAWMHLDAVTRTLFRVFVSRRLLLEWTPSSHVALSPQPSLVDFYVRMPGAVVSGVLAILIAVLAGDAWPVTVVLASSWLLSPAIAYWASLSPRVSGNQVLEADSARGMRLIARETWRFFETFVTEADNMLPPDNFQETPNPVVARRTSPTNIGLYLLSSISACDLGWIGRRDALARLEKTLATVLRMEKYRGHLLNWYDTSDLRPLHPRYVSSVDSGNFAGHLIVVANACRLWRQGPAVAGDLSGVRDALALLEREASRLRKARTAANVAWRRLDEEIAHFRRSLVGAEQESLSAQALRALSDEAAQIIDTVRVITLHESGEDARDIQFWAEAIRGALDSLAKDFAGETAEFDDALKAVEGTAMKLALETDFAFLLDPDRLLLSIGYQVAEGALDASCYDLLASEARLASFIAIAKRDAPSRHWFRLGRTVTPVGEGAALISWSGSMFEYLMPSLVMRAPADSLIERTNRLIVERQIAYAGRLGTPWGISESAYNERDLDLTYQYSNFGVPGLGLKRGLADSSVIAPYATALASMVNPQAAAGNFSQLEKLDARGRFGFYEALDFTPARVPAGERVSVVRAYMAHHQGMSICAIADVLLDGRMRDRFHSDPLVQATELLLQERVPREVTATPPSVSETTSAAHVREVDSTGAWRKVSPHTSAPATQLLSNSRYSVMLTAAGSGYSTWRNLAVTRWREDATCDAFGSYIFLRDVENGRVWSAGYQPVGVRPEAYDVTFNEERAEFSRRDGTLSVSQQVVVSAEDDAEVRRMTISNVGDKTREIEVTSYSELVLAPQASDQAHPAFFKLFVETEYLPNLGAVLATRRRRSHDEGQVWAASLSVVDGASVGKREFETDRARFIGRGADIRTASAIFSGRPLSGTTGTVLDPIFALRRRVQIKPGATVRIDFWTMVSESRDGVLDLIDKHHDVGAFQRAAALAWTQAQVQLHHLGINRAQAAMYQRLGGHVVYASPTLRSPSEVIGAGRGSQPSLWSMGISGDLPIVLVRISEMSELALVREALQAVEYLRMKRLVVDLVILNERSSSYVQDLQIALEAMVRASQSRPQIGGERPPGHIFMLRADLIAPEARALLGSIARIVLVGERGRLIDQLEGAPEARPAATPRPRPQTASELQISRRGPDMEYFNGIGGFSEDGKEYTVILGPGQSTPAPWINVVANEQFGFHASAEGGGYAWSVNSREHQLTPWSNDPVTDKPGQCIYIRDDETGDIWSPTALPIRDDASTYVARHGWGYTRFEHATRGIAAELLEYVPLADPLKISRLTLRNESASNRRLSVAGYVEWVLGQSRAAASPFVITSRDEKSGAIFAKNAWYPAFAERTAFLDMRGRQEQWTGDRREFIGRNGSLAWPAALSRETPLSGKVGAGLDPCAAMLLEIELKPGESREIVFLLGDAENEAAAASLIAQYRSTDLDAVLADVRAFWQKTLSTVQIKTPDRSMDIMLNGWLTYQTLAARVWARSGFYQASGAYGFRDQLQDCMALASVMPAMTREHILRAASRQFPEGDVQHWWLPHSGQGVRTRISDGRVWLAYATAHYVKVTGDTGILAEQLPFIEGEQLKSGEHDSFFLPEVSKEIASLYEHCARALDASLPVGRNGLPLIGGGDWNDGMNKVGQRGQGESVWLGWFLGAALNEFVSYADEQGDQTRAETWRTHVRRLAEALDKNAWDGQWYRRAWYDDGAILGSEANEECRIDAIAQSWAVLSDLGDRQRAAQAMASYERELILPNDGIALLFTPPFNRTPLDPGYIKGYPPGIRENGGQYTHAGLWSVMAFAALGQGDKAAALFWMINPINHTRTRPDIHRYKVEPYVVAADVYAATGHVGRGGWTWYTGSAGWMQRAGIESIIGIRVLNGILHVAPCIPSSWPRFEATVRFGQTLYRIEVENPQNVQAGVKSAMLDGRPVGLQPVAVPLINDGKAHTLEIMLG